VVTCPAPPSCVSSGSGSTRRPGPGRMRMPSTGGNRRASPCCVHASPCTPVHAPPPHLGVSEVEVHHEEHLSHLPPQRPQHHRQPGTAPPPRRSPSPTVNGQRSTVNGQRSTVNGQTSTFKRVNCQRHDRPPPAAPHLLIVQPATVAVELGAAVLPRPGSGGAHHVSAPPGEKM
jgi:hypothetical protein